MSGNDLALIAERVSPAAAEALVRSFGGSQVYLPEEPGEEHLLTRALGPNDARAVCQLLGPGHLNVPRGIADAHRQRGRRIIEMSEDGFSAGRIARELGCTDRTVRRWLARHRRRQRRG